MKIKYLGSNNLVSKGISFTVGMDAIEVPDADGRYLLNTFTEIFEEIEDKKVDAKKVEEKKPAVDKKKAD